MNVVEVKQIFEKNGGLELLKRYLRGGALATGIGEFILLGSSKKALEILDLSTRFKIKQKLEKQYKKDLEYFDKHYNPNLPHKNSKKIWVCWLQGLENAPDIVKKCYQTLQDNLNNHEIVLITSKNINDYIKFPDYIQNKIDLGIITNAHLSDLIRLELLLKYGGTWIDATVYCSNKHIPDYMLNSEIFLFQNTMAGHPITISNWFITAYSHNKLLAAVRYLLYKYWKNNNNLIDYFLFHIFFQIFIEKYPEEWEKVPPFSNATPHLLLKRLFNQYDKKIWYDIEQQCPFHKLTHKFTQEDVKKIGTYYDILIKEKNNRES